MDQRQKVFWKLFATALFCVAFLSGCIAPMGARNRAIASMAAGTPSITNQIVPVLYKYSKVSSANKIQTKITLYLSKKAGTYQPRPGEIPPPDKWYGIEAHKVQYSESGLVDRQKAYAALNTYLSSLSDLASSKSADDAADADKAAFDAAGNLTASVGKLNGSNSSLGTMAANTTGLFSDLGAHISKAIVQAKINQALYTSIVQTHDVIAALLKMMDADAQNITQYEINAVKEVYIEGSNPVLDTENEIKELQKAQAENSKAKSTEGGAAVSKNGTLDAKPADEDASTRKKGTLDAKTEADSVETINKAVFMNDFAGTNPMVRGVEIIRKANEALNAFAKSDHGPKATADFAASLSQYKTDCEGVEQRMTELGNTL